MNSMQTTKQTNESEIPPMAPRAARPVLLESILRRAVAATLPGALLLACLACGGGEEKPAGSGAGVAPAEPTPGFPEPTAVPWLDASAQPTPAPTPEAVATAAPAEPTPAGSPAPTPLPDLAELMSDLGMETRPDAETSYDVAAVAETSYDKNDLSAVIAELNNQRVNLVTPTPTPIPLGHEQKLDLSPREAGGASVSLLEAKSLAPGGPMAASSPGDYVLKNDRLMLVFAKVHPLKPLEKVAIVRKSLYQRKQGALVDVAVDGDYGDFVGEFTQSAGDSPNGPSYEYDSAEFVTRDSPPACGVRFTGSTVDDNVRETRIETTYWLGDGLKVEIETRPIIQPEGGTFLADLATWGPVTILADALGEMTQKAERGIESEWYAMSTGLVSAAVWGGGPPMKGRYRGTVTRVAAGTFSDGAFRRTLFFGRGNLSSVTDPLFEASRPVGFVSGRIVHKETDEPAPDAWVDILWNERPPEGAPAEEMRRIKFDPKLFTRIAAKPDGTYEAKLPADYLGNAGRYFVASGGRTRGGGRSTTGIVVIEGSMTLRDMYVSQPARLTVRVIDEKTSKTMAARIRFDAVPPTPRSEFMGLSDPKGYANFFYVPPEGGGIDINQGTYTLTASAGTRYDAGKVDVQTQWGYETEAVIVMRETSPNPGTVALDVGAMTDATPGCSISAEDRLLMTVGEGLTWIVSGDLETLTDFAPVIERMGLKGRVGSSRGFRTFSRARPEWGEFLLYPVAADAPDPATVRDEWSKTRDSKEMMATLRRLYPGAMIQVVTPFSDNGGLLPGRHGYFHEEGWNVYQMAWDDEKRSEELDFGVDAVNLFTSPYAMNYLWEKDFYAVNALKGRNYAPAPVSDGRTALGGEPGWPRMLIYADTEDPSAVQESDLFKRMKDGKWQVTSGPFIEFEANGRKPGDLYKPETDPRVKVSVTAPTWAPTRHIDVTKDYIMNSRESNLVQDPAENHRYSYEGALPMYADQKSWSDTMIGAQVWSQETIPEILPGRRTLPSFAIQGPTIADTNGNGKYDPIKDYRDKGK